MQNNNSINMVILDDYQNFFEKMKVDNRLPSMIDLSIFKNHFDDWLDKNIPSYLDKYFKKK